MLTSLFRYERIRTTKAKALAVRRTAEKMITRAKLDSVHNRRMINRDIKDQAVLAKMFTEIGPRFKERPGGYTRVLKLGPRASDAAEMVILELLPQEAEEPKKATKKAKAKSPAASDKSTKASEKKSSDKTSAAKGKKAAAEPTEKTADVAESGAATEASDAAAEVQEADTEATAETEAKAAEADATASEAEESSASPDEPEKA
jgi:large subunit ribosomal protein L17